MECIKCGRETDGSQTFCGECLEQMAKHPVKAGTPIHLPVRPAVREKAASHSRERATPSQAIARLQRTIRWLTVTIAILSLLLCATAVFLLHTLQTQDDSRPGRNYTVETDNSSP